MTTTCGSTVCLAVLRARVIGRHLRKPNRPCASLLSTSKNVPDPISGAGASARVRDPKTFLERRHEINDDVLSLLWRRCRIWRLLAKSKQGRNFKDFKGLKCRYTFGIRAEKMSAVVVPVGYMRCNDVTATYSRGMTLFSIFGSAQESDNLPERPAFSERWPLASLRGWRNTTGPGFFGTPGLSDGD